MKFKIKYNFKGGMSSTSSSSVPEENDNIILIFLPNKLAEITLQRKRITNHETGELNNIPNLTRKKENYKKPNKYGWIYESELDDPNFKRFKDNYLFPYNIFISFNIPINDDLLARWNICKNTSNQCELQSPHITLARLKIYNNSNLIKLLEKKDRIRHDLTNFLKFIETTTDQTTGQTTAQTTGQTTGKTTGQYKILGKTLPENIKDDIFNFNRLDELDKIKETLINYDFDNTECYLARVFYINNFEFLYDLIHKSPNFDENSFLDYEFYEQKDYQNFTVHLSLAKFYKISDALSALKNIYIERLPAGFDDIFTNPHYFNIQIS